MERVAAVRAAEARAGAARAAVTRAAAGERAGRILSPRQHHPPVTSGALGPPCLALRRRRCGPALKGWFHVVEEKRYRRR